MRAQRLLWFVPFLTTGCGDSQPAPEERVQAVAQEPAGADVLFEAQEPELPPAVEDNLLRVDPAYDEWRSEVLHDAAKKVLGEFVAILIDGDPSDDDRLGGCLDEAFEGTTWFRPVDLEERFDDGSTSVLRPRSLESDLEPRERILELARELRQPFGDAAIHPFLKIIRVDVEGPNSFATTALVHLDGVAQEGPIQVNMHWHLEWTAKSDAEVRIHSIELESYEEIHARQTLLGDLTHTVLGGVPRYAEELNMGLENYRHRTDQLLGDSFLGMQGIAVGDVDGDGWDDLYVAQQAGLPNRLLLHGPDGRAVDATTRSRADFLEATGSALLVDWDNDGDQDLIAAIGPGIVTARNDGSGIFRNHRLSAVETPGDIFSMSAADPDGDGDLDVYCCRYGEKGIMFGVPLPYHDANNGSSNIFFRNDGQFVDATIEVGLDENNRKYSLASIWEDFDEDGDLDLFVANDFGRDNLYRNEGGKFRDVAAEVGADDIAAGMGASAADYDLDGDFDLYISNMFSSAGLRIASQTDRFMEGKNAEVHPLYEHHARGNTLLANRGDGTFEDVTDFAGVSVGGWAWGAKFLDLNNDGFEDIISPDGFVTNPDKKDL